jgi:hypothetical protein
VDSGWWLVAGGWWLVAGGWWLVAGGWWLVACISNLQPAYHGRLFFLIRSLYMDYDNND